MPSIKSVVELDLHHLSSKDVEVCHSLLDPALWQCLEGIHPEGIQNAKLVIFAALSEAGQLAGLAVANYYVNLSFAKLLSIRFVPGFKHADAILNLVSALEQNLKSQNCLLLTYFYSDSESELASTAEILRQAGWGEPQLRIVRCHFSDESFKPAWFYDSLQAKLPKGFNIFPWSQLSPNDIQVLKHQQSESTFPPAVSPFHDQPTIDPISSLGLRYQGQVVGWMITNRLEGNVIRFSSLYIDREFRGTKLTLCLLARSIDLVIKAGIKHAILELNLTQADRGWITFVKEQLVPYTTQVERLFEIAHELE